MSIGRSTQDPAHGGPIESTITNGSDDGIFLFAAVTAVCVGSAFVAHHLLRRQIRREARSETHGGREGVDRLGEAMNTLRVRNLDHGRDWLCACHQRKEGEGASRMGMASAAGNDTGSLA